MMSSQMSTPPCVENSRSEVAQLLSVLALPPAVAPFCCQSKACFECEVPPDQVSNQPGLQHEQGNLILARTAHDDFQQVLENLSLLLTPPCGPAAQSAAGPALVLPGQSPQTSPMKTSLHCSLASVVHYLVVMVPQHSHNSGHQRSSQRVQTAIACPRWRRQGPDQPQTSREFHASNCLCAACSQHSAQQTSVQVSKRHLQNLRVMHCHCVVLVAIPR
mmetsp:Transcript_135063/g.234859  ORF Transcript_135063/g.234859 Transcript_135063/m.234859 type:complete len:218 (+) Transcript_135063:539-1192(+)